MSEYLGTSVAGRYNQEGSLRGTRGQNFGTFWRVRCLGKVFLPFKSRKIK